jgi:hypothetical protein
MMTNTNDTETASTRNESTQAIAHRNEDEILRWLHRFGYLTAPQVGALFYHGRSQSERLARRTLARLVKQGFLLIRKALIGAYHHYALSLSGARRVYDVYTVQAKSGKNLIRYPSAHRDAANWVAIKLHLTGWIIYTEREIQTCTAPFKVLDKKIPDSIGIEDWHVLWVEVEVGRKKACDVTGVAEWLVHHAFRPDESQKVSLNPPKDTLYLERVRFVIASPAAHTFPSRLRTALQKLLRNTDSNPYHFAMNQIEFQYGLGLDAIVQNGYCV